MSILLSGTWWPLSGGSNPEPSKSQPQNGKLLNNERAQSPTQPQSRSFSLWSWSAGLAPDLRETTDANSPLDNLDQPSEEPVSWWTTIVGPPASTVVNEQNKSLLNSNNADNEGNGDPYQPEHQQSNWSFWLYFLGTQQLDSESDTEDKRDLEAFREAKLAIESCKDSCHYAISKTHGLNEVYLAVHGTSTERSPVKFNEKRQPIMPHQYLEKVISDQKPSKTVEIQSNDQSRRSTQTKLPIDQAQTDTINNPKSQASQKLPASDSSKSLQNTLVTPGCIRDSNIEANGTVKTDIDLTASRGSYISEPIFPITPSLESNFRIITLSTKLRLWGEAIIQKEQSSERHIYKSTESSVERKRKRISKKALVISFHSFLPTKFVRSVISEGTGSASLIAENAVAAVQRWAIKGGIHDLQVQSISLEGVGVIESRKDKSLILLENWASDVNNSDFIFVVSNSIASPVAIQTLDHMFKSDQFDLNHKKIGLLSMSGALHGPVTGLDAKVIRRAYGLSEYDIIREMFELQRSNSDLSKRLSESTNNLCQYNVKLTMVGSVDDQLIPVFSSVFHQTSHPNLFKSLYVDEDVEVPGFVIRLISIILIMENVGYADHYQLLRDLLELSQGPLSSCTTHGDILKCTDVYDLGVKFALETTSLKVRKDVALNQVTTNFGETERNLYHLPWNVRGLINDLLQTKHIKSVKLLRDLVSDYRAWDPTTRPWREIKQCFAAFEETNPDDLML